MPVDFTKPAHILAVHGVQAGTDADVEAEDSVRKMVTRALARSHIQRDFTVNGYLYEDINDESQRFYQLIRTAITQGQPLAGQVLKRVIDVVGDVVTAARDTSTARRIRDGLVQKMLESWQGGHQLVVVAHSLGTVYTLDAVNELIDGAQFFVGDDRATWPVQGIITMGSPLGLEIDVLGTTIFEKRPIRPIGANFEVLRWHNYFNRLDPVVNGSVFGSPVEIRCANGPVEQRYGVDTDAAQWLLKGDVVTSGRQWLLAHTAYWKNPRIGDRLVELIWG